MSGEQDAFLADLVRGEAPLLYLLLDATGRVVEANQHARALLGRPPEGVLFADLLVVSQHQVDAVALGREGASRNLHLMTFTGLPQTLHCWFAADGERTAVLGAVDPTEQERLRQELLAINQELGARERALTQSRSELARASQLKDQFLGMAAHDLRSPITAIGFFADFLEGDLAGKLTAEDLGYVQGIRRSVELMRGLVDAFLDTALIESGHLTLSRATTSLEPVVGPALALLEPVARRRGLTLRTELEPGLPALSVDGPKLQQVVINLVNNAMQHSPPGSEVLVTARRAGAELVLEVQDRGAGIPPGLQASLFAAYVRGDRPKGTSAERSIGLGLAITRMIVTAHGGRVTCRSEPGQGSTFSVHLPVDSP